MKTAATIDTGKMLLEHEQGVRAEPIEVARVHLGKASRASVDLPICRGPSRPSAGKPLDNWTSLGETGLG